MTRRSEVSSQREPAGNRVDDIPSDPGALSGVIRVNCCIERAPQLPVCEHHLLHAGIVRVRPRDNLVVRRFPNEQQPPRAHASNRRSSRVVDRVALRSERRQDLVGKRAGAGLLLLRRNRVRAHGYDPRAQAERGSRRVEG